MMRSLRSFAATRTSTPVSSPFLPTFQASATCMPYVKSSSGAVVSTVNTAISAPVFCCSSSTSRVIFCFVAGSITLARSVTKPSGRGTCGVDTCAAAVPASSATAKRWAASLCTVSRDGGDHALDLVDVGAGQVPQSSTALRRCVGAPRQHLAHHRQRPDRRLGGGERGVVSDRRPLAVQAQQVADDDEEALQRIGHHACERGSVAGVREVEGAQAQQLAERFLGALAPQRRLVGRDARERVSAGDDAVLALDV